MSGMTSHGGGDRQPRTVFLTGGTGVWGCATLAEFGRRDGQYRVIMLVRPGPSAGATIAAYRGQSWLTVLEGDFTDPAVVRAGVQDADVVLHVGAVVSPFADEHPQLAMRVNTVGIRNIVDAVLALPDPGRVAVVGIGSVAEYGSRGPSVHWGRVGTRCDLRFSTATRRARWWPSVCSSSSAFRGGRGCGRPASFMMGSRRPATPS